MGTGSGRTAARGEGELERAEPELERRGGSVRRAEELLLELEDACRVRPEALLHCIRQREQERRARREVRAGRPRPGRRSQHGVEEVEGDEGVECAVARTELQHAIQQCSLGRVDGHIARELEMVLRGWRYDDDRPRVAEERVHHLVKQEVRPGCRCVGAHAAQLARKLPRDFAASYRRQ